MVQGAPEELGLAGFAAVQGLVAIATGNGFGRVSGEAIIDGVVHRLIVGLRPRI